MCINNSFHYIINVTITNLIIILILLNIFNIIKFIFFNYKKYFNTKKIIYIGIMHLYTSILLV